VKEVSPTAGVFDWPILAGCCWRLAVKRMALWNALFDFDHERLFLLLLLSRPALPLRRCFSVWWPSFCSSLIGGEECHLQMLLLLWLSSLLLGVPATKRKTKLKCMPTQARK